MHIPFTKMQGAGNDFIVIESFDAAISLSPDQIRQLCHRRFGIGADGLILLAKSPKSDFDAQMIYFNANGSRGEMCGNGVRCLAAAAFDRGFGKNDKLRILTDAGPVKAALLKNDLYEVDMPEPTDFKLKIELEIIGKQLLLHLINTGVPHIVHFCNDIDTINLANLGPAIRYHDAFSPQGVNVNIAQIDTDQTIRIRTYERGVENETLACGTGATATALIAHLLHKIEKPVPIEVASGEILTVDFEKSGGQFSNVTLSGPAKTVFHGTFIL